jgi:hypothetical protein
MLVVQAEIPERIGSGVQPIALKIADRDNSPQNATVWREVEARPPLTETAAAPSA